MVMRASNTQVKKGVLTLCTECNEIAEVGSDGQLMAPTAETLLRSKHAALKVGLGLAAKLRALKRLGRGVPP